MAVESARAAVGELGARHVVMVGAGENAEQIARAFAAHGVATMFVANRRRERAIALAQRFGGASGSFDELPAELARADVVVSSTASPHAIIGAEELGGGDGGARRPPAAAGRPRGAARHRPGVRRAPGVTLVDMDTLQAQVRGHLGVRRAEAVRAEAIVEDEIQTSRAGSGGSTSCRR